VKPVLLEEFVATGKIRFVTRHYAFLGPESTRAAEASECAAEQGAFERFADLLYANQRGRNDGGFSDVMLTHIAEFIDLDAVDFATCLASERHLMTVQQDVDDAIDLDVRGTPSVFVNGAYVTPADVSAIVAAIEEALGGTSP